MTETGYRRPSGVSVRLLVGVVLAGTLSVLDSTIVVPLLSSIGEDLGGGSEVSWLVAGYLLASTVSIPLWGRWMDLRGERTAMWAAVSVFLLGTIVSAMAPSLGILILGRVIQGLGAGGVVPLGQAVLAARCSSGERARLQLYYNIAYGLAAGLGPLIGGALVSVSVIRMSSGLRPFERMISASRRAPNFPGWITTSWSSGACSLISSK